MKKTRSFVEKHEKNRNIVVFILTDLKKRQDKYRICNENKIDFCECIPETSPF